MSTFPQTNTSTFPQIDAVSGAHPAAPKAPSFTSTLGVSLSIGSMLGSAIGSVYSAWSNGKILAGQIRTQELIAEYNRRGAQMGKESALRAGEDTIAKITSKAGQVIAKQRVSYAANGVALGVGSAREVQLSSRIRKDLDVINAENNAVAASWGFSTQALNTQLTTIQSGIDTAIRREDQNAKAVQTLLGTIGEASQRWDRYKNG